MAPSLLDELKRRRVVRAVIGYGVVAFALLQIIEPIMHGLHWPDEVLSYLVAALAAGFPVVVGFAWIFDLNAGRIERTGPAAGLKAGRVVALLAGIAVLAAAPGIVWYLVLRPGARAKQVTPSEAPAGPSIAVLPLVNLSSDKEQDYFSDGLAEELLDLLAKVPGLRVAGRTSSFAFKGRSEDLRAIGQKLNVDHLLEGSVRKSGDRIRITTQLINAGDGYHLWSETYDRKLTDIFAVQDEIAQAVVSALKLRLLPASAASERGTKSPEAYNEYLLARQFFLRNSQEDHRRASQAYRRAVELDPGYADAWAGLAEAQLWVADAGRTVTAIEAGRAQARASADKAVALRPDLAHGYLARGSIRALAQWDWAGAEKDLRQALSLAPANADVLLGYSFDVLTPLGRLDESEANLRKAAAVDPLNPIIWSSLSHTLLSQGKLAAAREAANRSLEISPDQLFAPVFLGFSYLAESQPADALAVAPRASNELFRWTLQSLAHHDLGHAKESQQFLDEMIAKDPEGGAYQIAEVYAWRGETGKAFEWLLRARAQHDSGLGYMKIDPLLRKLRGDPRWKPLLQSVNLPPD